MSKNDIITKVQEKKKLPERDVQGLFDYEPVSTKDELEAKKKEKVIITKAQIEEAIMNGTSDAFIEVLDAKGKKKRIRFNPDPNKGLKTEIVEYQIRQKLVNDKPKGSTQTIPLIIFRNTFTFFNIMMIGIALWLIISAIMTDTPIIKVITQLFFLVIVTINTVVSIVQEIRSKKIIDKLSNMNAPQARVIREGISLVVPIDNVVLDDILVLNGGMQIPSDAIIVDGSVEVNESLLTGESDAIEKKIGDVLHSGSFIVSGNCKAKVERIGKDNYIQQLTSQAQKYRKPKSDLMRSLRHFIIAMAIIIVPLGTGVFLRMYNGVDFGGSQEYMYSVSHTAGAVIGMIPSGLFLCTSIALAVSVIRLAQYNTLVQDLYCIEMLARVDVLCLDKTGTITDGSMKVHQVIEYKNEGKLKVNDAIGVMQNILEEQTLTSMALNEYFQTERKIKYRETIPFSSQRKYSAVTFDKYGTYLLGAPEFILKKDKYAIISKDVEIAANEGYRVLLLARSDDYIKNGEFSGTNVEPVALIYIVDNIRDDAIETIKYFKDSGVGIKVISGDNPLTVSRISARAGIENSDKYISLDGLTDEEVIMAARDYVVFGRVSPNQKKLLIMTLKELGHTVAMTGDGVNDILALREADCSISLASGSDAARNVSHLVLLDSNFNSMPKVVTEGRRVINNIEKVASLFLTKTMFSLFIAIFALLRRDYPIQTNQLFIIEFFVIGVPSFVLALEPNNNRFKGRFMANVIRNALPGAVVVAVTTVLIFSLQEVLGLNAFENRTIIVISATFVCYVVLYRVCRPFNLSRRILFATMSLLGFFLIVLVPNLLDIAQILPLELGYLQDYPQLQLTGKLILMVMILLAYPLIVIISNLPRWIKEFTNFIVKALGKSK